MTCFIELLKCILCCEEEHFADRYQDSHTNHSHTRVPTSTLSRDPSPSYQASHTNHSYTRIPTSTLYRDPSPSYIRRHFEEDAKIKIVGDHVKTPVLINASLVKGSSSVKNSVQVKPPGFTPKTILLPPVPIPSIVLHKNSGSITNKSLALIDPLLPSSSHLSNPPKETENARVKKGTTIYEVPDRGFQNFV